MAPASVPEICIAVAMIVTSTVRNSSVELTAWETSPSARSSSTERVSFRRARAQFAEQPGVLDGDDGLGGEILQQRHLLVGKRPDFLPEDDDRADQYMVLEHWHAKSSSRAAHPGYQVGDRFSASVGVAHLLCPQQTAIRAIG